ncbi:acyltransferase family protein [Cryobacterium sp. SO2]|uniref:acyltransferase family protein n=1 Tax=Cryobacterium sp. SO2 TaxID=1897060 RepID=UPI00223D7F8B|nr:acyltransferase family protein [Cryobacterium sp. SO2]WEO78040.1 acyltransferase family protein [Cryobacterium sp. SO2]
MTNSDPATPKKWFRGDINGLRAFAIIPVVVFHAGITAIPGGFVGVDIFYVISGFLITSILLKEATATGTIRFGTFWAKRLRRLVPAMALMVLVALPVAALLASPSRWPLLGKQAGASLLYFSNLLFAQQSTDYFAVDVNRSPFLHTWSLGVEEQFYVVWPFLILLGCWIAYRRRIPLRRVLAVAFGITFVVSLGLSIWATDAHPTWAFYMLPTRAWEFAAAGLLATLPVSRLIRTRRVGTIVTVAGLALLGYSFFGITENDPFPSYIALIPVLGTLLVIAGGSTPTMDDHSLPSRLLAARPVQWIGTISYSWYLWHWPFIILTAAALQTDSVLVKCVAAIASLGAAALGYYFVENPLRYSRRLTVSLKRTFIFAAAVTAGLCLLAGSVYGAGRYINQLPLSPIASAAKVAISITPDDSCDRTTPSESGIPICELGDVDSATTVMLVGDSHAAQWKAAMATAASESGIRLVMRWHSACPAIQVQVLALDNVRDKSCAPYQDQTLELAKELQPTAVIVSQSSAYDGEIIADNGSTIPESEQLATWETAYKSYLAELTPATGTVGVVVDNPRLDFEPNECLVRWHLFPDDCSSSRADAFDEVSTLNDLSQKVWTETGVTQVFDVTDQICTADRCAVIDDGVPVFRDYNHLSATWTATQVPKLKEWFAALT